MDTLIQRPLITVYTPTFNRAYTLHKCYESLLKQTSKNFEWIIIDDGSTDNTKSIVYEWIKQDLISIKYYFQENSGVHIARNKAIELCETELNVCIDSDDYMPKNAIELIEYNWNNKLNKHIIGLVGWDIYETGKVVGEEFPKTLLESRFIDLYDKYNIPGDKKPVYLTEIAKKFPSPSFENEKYFPNKYKYMECDKLGTLQLIHQPLCIVEYLEDGISANLFKRYLENPKGFEFYREYLINNDNNLYRIIKNKIHLIAMRILLNNNLTKSTDRYKVLNYFTFVPGYLLLSYIKLKANTKRKIK